MKLQDILKERGTWGSYSYRRSQIEEKPSPIKLTHENNDICSRIADEILSKYSHLIEKRHIKRMHLQMIIGKVCSFMPQHQLPEFDYVEEYIRKNHRIKVK